MCESFFSISLEGPYDRNVRIARPENSSDVSDVSVANDNAQNDNSTQNMTQNVDNSPVFEELTVPGQAMDQAQNGAGLALIAGEDGNPSNLLEDEHVVAEEEENDVNHNSGFVVNAQNDGSEKNVDNSKDSLSFEKLNFSDLGSSDDNDENLSNTTDANEADKIKESIHANEDINIPDESIKMQATASRNLSFNDEVIVFDNAQNDAQNVESLDDPLKKLTSSDLDSSDGKDGNSSDATVSTDLIPSGVDVLHSTDIGKSIR